TGRCGERGGVRRQWQGLARGDPESMGKRCPVCGLPLKAQRITGEIGVGWVARSNLAKIRSEAESALVGAKRMRDRQERELATEREKISKWERNKPGPSKYEENSACWPRYALSVS